MSDDPSEMDLPSVVIDFVFTVRMVRVVDNILVPSVLEVRAEVMPEIEGEASDEDIDVAFTKIKFWFDQLVGRCVAFGRGNEHATSMLIAPDGSNRTGNQIMVTPEDPSDEHLAALFQSKMTALSGGALGFGAVRIRSDNVSGLQFTFVGRAEDVLPGMPDWIGQRSYFEKPWWDRDDASTLDVTPAEDADLTKPPAWAYSLEFLRQAVRPAQPGGQVVRPSFRPTVHDGGRKDE